MVSDNYDDIIDWEYDGVRRHHRMSDIGRAAQFAPFAALTGYNDALDEGTEIALDAISDIEFLGMHGKKE